MRVGKFGLLVTAVLLLAGCGSSEPVGEPAAESSPVNSRDYRFPERFGPMTTVWQASPGIDLTSREATIVRAFWEGKFIQWWGAPSEAFPGYVELTTGPNAQSGWGEFERPSYGGTRRMRLQSISVDGPDLTAVVCDDVAGMYKTWAVGIPPSHDPSDLGPGGLEYMPRADTRILKMRRVGPAGPWPAEVDVGRARAPNWDVFEGLELIDWTFAEYRSPEQIQCDEWSRANYPGVIDPGPPARRMYPNGYNDPESKPELEQYPGWTQVGQP